MPSTTNPAAMILLALARACVLMVPGVAFLAGDVFLPEIYQGYVAWKHFAFRILVEVAVGAWCLLALIDPHYRPRFSWPLVAITVFVGVMTVANVFGVHPAKSTWTNLSRMQGSVANLHLLGFVLVAGSVLDSSKLWMRFFQVSLGVCAAICLAALRQYFGAPLLYDAQNAAVEFRLDARLANPVFLGVYVMLHVFLAAWCWSRSTARGGRWLCGAALALFVVVLFGTGTRAAWFGLAVGAAVATLPIALRSDHPRLRKNVARSLAAFVVVGAVVGLLLWLNPQFVQKNLQLTRLRESFLAIGMRSSLWNVGWQGFLEHPILGWGEYAFRYVFDRHYEPSLLALGAWADSPHNVFVEWLVAGGVLGLVSFVAILVTGGVAIWSPKARDWTLVERGLATGLVVGWVVFSLAQPDSLTATIPVFAIFAMAHSRSVREFSGGRPAPRIALPIGAVLVLGLVGWAVEFVNLRHVRVASDLMSAARTPLQGQRLAVRDALVPWSFALTEAREELIRVATQLQGAEAPEAIKRDAFELARTEIDQEIESDPESVRALFLAGALMNRFGRHGEAGKYLGKAQQLSPKRQEIYFEIANAQLGVNDRRKALAAARHALDLGPNSSVARSRFATIAVLAGARKAEEEALAWLRRRTFMFDPDPHLANALYRAGREERLIEIYEPLATHTADFYQKGRLLPLRQASPEDRLMIAHVRLAGAYHRSGKTDRAVATLQRLAEIHPSVGPQTQVWIAKMRAGEPVDLWVARQAPSGPPR